MRVDGELKRIEDWESMGSLDGHTLELLIDRLVIEPDNEDNNSRLADSVQTAFYEGNDECIVEVSPAKGDLVRKTLSNRFEADGIAFETPSVHLFSFNNPFGACKTCEGFGTIIGIDEDLVIPDKSLSVYEGCVAPWKGEKMGEWKDQFVKHAMKVDFPVHRAYYDLDPEHREMLWKGTPYAEGIDAFFRQVEEQTYKIQYRVMLSRYRGKTTCPDCRGTRLRKDAGYVKVGGMSIQEIVLLPVSRPERFSTIWNSIPGKNKWPDAFWWKFAPAWGSCAMWDWDTLPSTGFHRPFRGAKVSASTWLRPSDRASKDRSMCSMSPVSDCIPAIPNALFKCLKASAI